MEQLESLDELARDLHRLGDAEFHARYPDAAFVLGSPEDLDLEALDETHGPLDDTRIVTFGRAELSQRRPGVLVYFLIKTERNPYRTMITIGRSPVNDIVLESGKVSRIHAYLELLSDGTHVIHDHNSTNGTWIGSHRLAGREGATLRCGTTIALADDVVLHYRTPVGLRRLLAKLAA